MYLESTDLGNVLVTAAGTGAARILYRCDELARLSDDATCLTRTFLSPALANAHVLVGEWMHEAGLQTRVDALGNLIGHYPAADESPNAPVFLLGSHLDTVPNAGKYDGMLGVLLAIEAIAALKGKRLPFAIDVFGFSDEEGVRFGTPYLGSKAIAGTFDPALFELVGQDELSVRQVMQNFGLDTEAWTTCCYTSRHVLGYFEVHIEQGPVLEAEVLPLAVVTAIVGQSRWRVRFTGQAGHAGTQPMNLRRDALVAASEWIVAVEDYACNTDGLKATVGFVDVEPNAPNVVPGQVLCSLDVRHADDEVRETAVQDLLDLAVAIGKKRQLQITTEPRSEQKAVPMDAKLSRTLCGTLVAMGVEPFELESGAGHDAVVLSALTPCAMLFVRTPGGASHCPEEAVERPDVELALKATVGLLSAKAEEVEGENVGLV